MIQCYKFLAREQGGNDGVLSRNGSSYSQLALIVPIFNSFSQVLYIVCSLKWLPACRSCVQMYPVQCPVSPLWPNSSSEWNRASCQVSLPPLRICGRHFQLPIYNGLWRRNICTQMIDKTDQYHHFKASVPLWPNSSSELRGILVDILLYSTCGIIS